MWINLPHVYQVELRVTATVNEGFFCFLLQKEQKAEIRVNLLICREWLLLLERS